MITININHAWCRCSWTDDPKEFLALQTACSYLVSDAWRSELFLKGFWDGRKILFYKDRLQQSGKFPTGILSHVLGEFSSTTGLNIQVEDERIYPIHAKVPDYSNLTFSLREKQDEAARVALEKRRGIIRFPTAYGKTKTGIAILRTLNLPTLWLTHEGSLANQSYNSISEGCTEPPGLGFYAGESKKIDFWTVGLVQALHRRRKELQWWFDQIKVLLIDECHHAGASTWFQVAMMIPAPFRFGVSATPFERSDESFLELQGVTGELIYSSEADEDGVRQYLSRPHVEMIHCPAIPTVIAAEWNEIFRIGVVENEWRNKCIINRAMISVREEGSCLIFVSIVEHGEMLSRMLLEEIGVQGFHEFISGQTHRKHRTAVYDRLKQRDLRVVIATDGVAGEGVDVPVLDRIIVAGGRKAAIIAKQRAGRGMRISHSGSVSPEEWGGRVDLHDFVDHQHTKLLIHSDWREVHYKEIGAIIEHTHET